MKSNFIAQKDPSGRTGLPDAGECATELRLPFTSPWRVMWGGDQRGLRKYFGSQVGHNALEFVQQRLVTQEAHATR